MNKRRKLKIFERFQKKPRFFSKKALAMEAWAALILALLLGGGMAAVTYKYITLQEQTKPIEICHASLTIFKQLKHQASVLGIPPKVDCPVIKEKINTKKKPDAMLKVADHLKNCWYKTLGKDNSIGVDFAESSLLPRYAKELDVDFCLVCSEFTVNHDITAEELQTFMSKRTIANSHPKKTYAEYLDTSWGWEETLRGTPISREAKLVHPDNKGDFEYTNLKASKDNENTYYVISLNAASEEGFEDYAGGIRTSYNHIFIIPKSKISKIKCEIFHYQEE